MLNLEKHDQLQYKYPGIIALFHHSRPYISLH